MASTGPPYPKSPTEYEQATAPYPPAASAPYPTQETAYPPPQSAYPPPQSAYPPPQSAYPPPQSSPHYAGDFSNQSYEPQTGYQDAPSGSPPPYPGTYTGDLNQQQPPKYGDVEASPAVGFTGGPFSDKAIRRAFIRKVYLILMSQLIVTVGFICLFLFVKPVKKFVQANPAMYYVSYATFLVTYIALACCPTVRRRYPGNFIALLVFTLAFSYMVGTIASFYEVSAVLIAAGITCGICLAITLFSTFTKIDFTLCTGLIFVLSVGLLLFGFSCIIVWRVQGSNYVLQAVYGGLAAVVFGLFLAYDTQVVLGGKRYELSEEEYIFGALQLYLDVVYLFLIVLSFFGNKN